MSLQEFWQQFFTGMQQTGFLEYTAVFAGIASVWFSRKEDIWVYPVGLVSTIIYVYLSFQQHLIGEASVNIYYSILSIYGWILWAQKDKQQHHILHITYSDNKEWKQQLLFGGVLYIVIFFALIFLKKHFYPGIIPAADAFASATAYTGMWLMAKKKVESWYWWIATNIASVPLYFVKGFMFSSVFYIVLLVMAVFGLLEWKKRAKSASNDRLPELQMTNS